MTEPYLGQISIMAFDFAPRGWALCDGAILPIAQNSALYSLLGTTFGGNGTTTFGLPDLRGRVPIHVDASHRQGAAGGAESRTLTSGQMPMHTHTVRASKSDGDSQSPSGTVLAQTPNQLYESATPDSAMAAAAVGTAGASVPYDAMQPYQVVSFVIALQGVFPSRN